MYPFSTTIFLRGNIETQNAARSGVRTHAHYAPGLKSGSLDHSDNRAVNILKTYLGLAPRED